MIRTFIALFIALTLASTATADGILIGPDTVQADREGNFTYTVTLIAGSGCVGWTGFGYGGVENVVGGGWVDTFCLDPQPVEYGEAFEFEVFARLDDLSRPGTAFAESGFCVGGYFVKETTILPPAVPVDEPGWSTLKARYR